MGRIILRSVQFVVMASILVFGNSVFAAQAYNIDKAHSSVGFSVAHLMVSKTTGVFMDYEGAIAFSADDLANSRIDMTIKAARSGTHNEMRDKHLRSADFFEVEKYPLIVFKSKKIEDKGEGNYLVTGDLTMKAVTKEVEIPVTLLGPVMNPMGQGGAIGLEAQFKINRQDYGVNWNKKMDNGGWLVGDIVELRINLEADTAVAPKE